MQNSRPPEEVAGTPHKRGRGRPRAFDREAALEQAMCLFWRKGFEATSIADLTGALGIGAPSLYAAFGSKEALYAEALRHYQERFGSLTWERFAAAPTLREAVELLLLDSAAALTAGGPGDPRGCMLVLSSVGRDEHAEIGAALSSGRAEVLQRLQARLARAVSAREISGRADVRALARFIQTGHHGMSLLARDGADRAELESVARVAMAGWDATVVAAG
jgi:AcrR family transcriptional regulator